MTTAAQLCTWRNKKLKPAKELEKLIDAFRAPPPHRRRCHTAPLTPTFPLPSQVTG